MSVHINTYLRLDILRTSHRGKIEKADSVQEITRQHGLKIAWTTQCDVYSFGCE
jgi:hypothetical protein